MKIKANFSLILLVTLWIILISMPSYASSITYSCKIYSNFAYKIMKAHQYGDDIDAITIEYPNSDGFANISNIVRNSTIFEDVNDRDFYIIEFTDLIYNICNKSRKNLGS